MLLSLLFGVRRGPVHLFYSVVRSFSFPGMRRFLVVGVLFLFLFLFLRVRCGDGMRARAFSSLHFFQFLGYFLLPLCHVLGVFFTFLIDAGVRVGLHFTRPHRDHHTTKGHPSQVPMIHFRFDTSFFLESSIMGGECQVLLVLAALREILCLLQRFPMVCRFVPMFHQLILELVNPIIGIFHGVDLPAG